MQRMRQRGVAFDAEGDAALTFDVESDVPPDMAALLL
jgi:hypothetical protein